MTNKTIYKCRWCGKENAGKLYCNDSHKNKYYQRLRNVKTNSKTPEEFIKEELDKPLNPLYAKVEKVAYVPRKRTMGVWVGLLTILDKEMVKGEIRRLPVDMKSSGISNIKYALSKIHSDLSVFHRTVDGQAYLYFERQEK